MNEIKDENDDIQMPMLKIQKRVNSFELTLFLYKYLKRNYLAITNFMVLKLFAFLKLQKYTPLSKAERLKFV